MSSGLGTWSKSKLPACQATKTEFAKISLNRTHKLIMQQNIFLK